jgi:Domain of unknown function (DUF4389)
VTGYSPYQAYPGSAPVIESPPPILFAVADPVPQRRVTVFFRFFLLVPHIIVLGILGMVGGLVAFVGWWGALFTGRLPDFAVTFLSGLLRWSARVSAYEFLLTDVYPPFTLDDDPSYPVRVAIPEPQRLNRAAVFFRYFLAFPAALLLALITWGAGTIVVFIAWLITLITGQMPPSLHQAYVAVLRFQLRYTGYYYMLTPAYPGGLHGDLPGAVAWADGPSAAQAPGFGTQAPGFGAPGPAYGVPQGYESAPGYGAPGYGAPGYGAPTAGYDPTVGYGASAASGVPAGYNSPRPAFQPATWLLQLTTGARKLVTSFIVIGALFVVVYIVAAVLLIALSAGAVNNNNTAATAIPELNSSYNTLTSSMNTWEQAQTSCNQNLTCVTKADGKAATAFSTFSSQLSATAVPSTSDAEKAKLSAVSASAAQDFSQLSHATSVAQYQSIVSGTGVQSTLTSFESDYTTLINKLQTYLAA